MVSTVGSIQNQARRGGDIRLEVASAVIKGQKTNFVMRPGYQDALLCPSCQRRRIEILLPELGSSSKGHRVARSSPTAVSSTAAAPDDECEPQTNRRFAFSAALWASENGGGIESAKYITDAIHVGYQLQSAMRLNPRVDAEVDRVLLAAGSGFPPGSGFPLLELLWKVRPVEHVQVDASLLGTCQRRFTKVFTKIRHWDLEEYELVAALDLDLLVKPGVTDLLGCRPPAAFFRGTSATAGSV